MTFTISKVLLPIVTLMTMIHTTACSRDNADTTALRPVVVAHRGGAALGMENSLSCIEKGIAAGADMIEVDVHMTADSQLVVCHDVTVNRTTDGRGRIETMTLAEVRRLHLLRDDGSVSDETLPTLAEVLQSVKGRCGLLLEIKKKRHQYEGIEKKVAEMLVQYEMVEEVAVQSFNGRVLEELHRLLPALRLEKLSFLPPQHPEKCQYVASYNVWYLSVGRHAVKRVHDAGKEMKVWTVDKTCLPVDGVITNNPTLFKK